MVKPIPKTLFRQSTSSHIQAAIIVALVTLAITLHARSGAVGGPQLTSQPKTPQPASYNIVALANAFGLQTIAVGINNRGSIIGTGVVNHATYHNIPLIWRDGKWKRLEMPPGALSTDASSINDADQVVGSATKTDPTGNHTSVYYAYLWSKGHANNLGRLNGDQCDACKINDSGVVVGYAEGYPATHGPDVDSYNHALSWQRLQMRFLPSQNDFETEAESINDHGQIVGSATNLKVGIKWTNGTLFYGHAQVWRQDKMIDLGTLGGLRSEATDVNNLGDIVGNADTVYSLSDIDAKAHACMWRNDKLVDLGTLGGPMSAADKINDRDQVIGISQVRSGDAAQPSPQDFHSFLWQSGRMIDVNALIPTGCGWTDLFALDINNRGQIVGTGVFKGTKRSFLMTPK